MSTTRKRQPHCVGQASLDSSFRIRIVAEPYGTTEAFRSAPERPPLVVGAVAAIGQPTFAHCSANNTKTAHLRANKHHYEGLVGAT